MEDGDSAMWKGRGEELKGGSHGRSCTLPLSWCLPLFCEPDDVAQVVYAPERIYNENTDKSPVKGSSYSPLQKIMHFNY